MSLAQFEDFFDICCCENMGDEEMAKFEMRGVRSDHGPKEDMWWKDALKEVEKEKEKELLHV